MCEGEVLRLEGVIKDQANLIEDLKAQLRTVSSLSESQLLSASNRVSDRQSQIYQSLISQLREEVSGNKKLLAAARGLLELEKATCKNQEKELEKRRRQLEESIENSKALEKELKKVRTECSEKNWEARERILAMKINAARMEDEKKIAALEARIELKLRQEASLLDELTSLRTLHEKCEREKLVRDEECKKHQTEVERLKSELEKQKSFQNSNASRRVVRTESMEDKLISQVNSLSRQLENLKGSSLSEVGYKSLHEKVDSLVSVETYLKERLEASQQAEEKLKLELDNMAKNLATKDSDIATLNKRIEEQEEQFRLTNEYLVQENVKIKHQKAEIRCELLELKRRYSRLENVYENNRQSSSVVELEVKSAEEMEDPRKSSCGKELRTKKSTNSKQEDQKWCLEMSEVRNVSIVREVETHSSEIKLAEVPPILGYNIHVKTLVDASTECSDVQNEEAEKAMKLLAEEVVVKDTVIEKLQKEIVTLQDETFKLKKLATYLDDQCEKLMTAKKRAEVGRTKLSEELAKRSSDLSVLRLEVENYRQKEEQSAVNMKVNERLEQQNKYLQDELTEMNTQHRLEITRLAKEMSETKKKDATENECFAIEIRRLKTEKRQMEATLQSLERQLEQGVTQKNLQTEEVKSLRENCTRLNEENAKLRNGLQTAIEKVEKFKEDFEKGNEERLQLKEEIQKMQEAQRDAEAKIDQLTETLNTKERLVVYLKNQQKVCQNEKAFKKASSFSTLISEGSEVSVISDVSVVDIEEQENRPKTSSTSLKKALEQPVPLGESSQNNIHSVPLLRDPNVNIDKSSNHDSNFPVSSNSDEIGSAGPICAEYQRSGTMKHDIPHRWKSFLALKQVKCVVCMEGIPRVRHAMKCSECGIIAHRCCYVTVVNTCGLPSQCADYFLNTYPGSTKPRTMSGWVKIWRSNHSLGGKWKNAFASINSCRLCFYNNDGLSAPSINCAPPFYEVNLERDKWRIQWQAVPDVGIKQDLSKDSYSLLIEIRLPTDSLFILAPTVQAKTRWMEALQAATTQRMIVKRRPSAPTAGGNSLILALDAPLNIGINCTQVLGECFLIGANEGLFITSFHSPKVPINVSGLSAVYHMELLHDLDMMVAISGPQRNLVILHVADLHAAFKSDMPFVRATPISGTDHCHLLTIHHDARKQKRYLCVADPDKITLMQFNSRLNIFTTSTFIPTAEPATCLLSMPFGIVFGADSFYFVDLDKLQPVALNIADCPNDWPLGAVAVSSNEMLLAFQNFGVFVDVRGNRTRRETVDWEQAPLEFVYALPYLFVVHYDTLEIMQVAKYEGSDSRGLLNERDVFRCQNAHFTGRGRTEKEVIFSLSAADRVEVHRFDCSGARKSSLKRRQNHESDERKCMKKAA